MTALSWPPKDPDETLDYEVLWSDRMPTADFVVTSTWAVPSDLAQGADEISADGKVTTVWLSSGVLGATYDVVNTVITNDGRIMQQTVRIKVKAR